MKRLHQRAGTVLLAGILAAGMLAGCGSSSSSTSSGSSSGDSGESTSSSEDHTLSVTAWDSGFNIPALEAAAADYQENVDPDFVLEINEVSGGGDAESMVTLAASAGDYSTLTDIMLFQDHYFHRYATDYPDAWISIDDADIDWSDFMSEKVEYTMVDGVHYGVPMDSGTVIAAYRIDLLEEAGYTIDDLTGCTWAQFIEIGEAVWAATGKYLLSINGDGGDLVYMMLQAEGVSQFKDGEPYVTENETLIEVIELILEMNEKNVLYLANDWTGYTDESIVGDRVAGVINGNWIIPTIELVEENSGKWEITSLPTINGGEGYAANGGSALYITANCDNVDLAKAFLSYTFGGSTETYDNALLNGGVITTCLSAAESDVYSEPVEYFNNQAIYADIAAMGEHVPVIEQSDYHYTYGEKIAAAIINIRNGADLMSELEDAEEQIRFAMGL